MMIACDFCRKKLRSDHSINTYTDDHWYLGNNPTYIPGMLDICKECVTEIFTIMKDKKRID